MVTKFSVMQIEATEYPNKIHFADINWHTGNRSTLCGMNCNKWWFWNNDYKIYIQRYQENDFCKKCYKTLDKARLI